MRQDIRVIVWTSIFAAVAVVAMAQPQPRSGGPGGGGPGGPGQRGGPPPGARGAALGALDAIFAVGPIVRGAPYSGEGLTTTAQTLADGTRIDRTVRARLYRDSEGRTRREQTILVMSKHHDPRTGDVEYRLTNVSRAEPPRDLFTPPADYTIMDAPPPPPPASRRPEAQ